MVEADQLALLDEASRHVLFDRCHEHAGARTGDDEFPAALAGTLEIGHHAVDLLLQNRRLGLVGRAHSRVLATQPSQLSLQHLDARVEEGVISFNKGLPGLNLGTICDEKTSNEAVRPGADLGAFGGPRDAFCHRAQWERHDEEEQACEADSQCGERDGAGPVSLQTRARRKKRKPLTNGNEKLGGSGQYKKEPPDDKKAGTREYDDRDGNEWAVEERRDAKKDDPRGAPPIRLRKARVARSEGISFNEVAEIAGGTLAQVWQFESVRQHVVAVEAQQRIAVEQDRGDSADQDNVVGHGVSHPNRGVSKDENRDGRQQHLNANSDRSDHHALSFVREAR